MPKTYCLLIKPSCSRSVEGVNMLTFKKSETGKFVKFYIRDWPSDAETCIGHIQLAKVMQFLYKKLCKTEHFQFRNTIK